MTLESSTPSLSAAPDDVRGPLLHHVVLLVAAHVERPRERERHAA